jgi:putative redox protein
MRFTVDEEKIIGDLDYGDILISTNVKNGYRPFELFVSSLVGCSGTLLRNILNKKKIAFGKIEMEVTSIRNPDHANRIEQLTLTAYVETDETLTHQQLEKIAELVVKNCGMIQSVIQSIKIGFAIQFSSHPGGDR